MKNLSAGLTFAALTWRERTWHTVEADVAVCPVRLRLSGMDAGPTRDFLRIIDEEKAAGYKTVWMMNAGMFRDDGMPVGLCVVGGKEITAVRTEEGTGNFYLKPNGVFGLTDSGPVIRETGEWMTATPSGVQYATQSGPLLVQRGRIHPAFRKESLNRNIRNGVGVRTDGRVIFAISADPVTFHEMATLFRDALHCPDALYLDGAISAMHAPAAGIISSAKGLGPVFGVWVAE